MGKKKRPGLFPVTHGVYTWLRTGKVNPSVRGHRRLQRYLKDLRRDLIEQLGGPEAITPAQEALIESTIQALGVQLLAGAYCQRFSILRPDLARRGILEFQPVLGKSLLAYINTVRQNLIALGLERRKADEVLNLGRYIAEKYGPAQGGKGEEGPDK